MTENVGTPSSIPLGPIGERDRIAALDVLRGFALLGIFFVNMPFFAGTFAALFGPIGGADATNGERAAYAFIKIFCEYKFISMFSLLFGMGLVVMMTRAKAAGRPYVAVYLRRLFILALFGLGHVVFLWYGDILVFYALCGVILLILSIFSARALIITAVSVFLLAGVLISGLGALQVGMAISAQNAAMTVDTHTDTDADTGADAVTATDAVTDADTATDAVTDAVTATDAETDPAPDADADTNTPAPLDREALRRQPFRTALNLMLTDQMFLFGERWAEIERVAYAEGPFRTAASVRFFTWAFILLQMAFSFAWRIIAVFAAGAGLMKLDFFSPRRSAWHGRMAAIGLGVGLPLEVIAFSLSAGSDYGASWRWLAGESLHYFGSMVLCFGYVGVVVLIVHAGRMSAISRAFAAVGRMALTNYILQSVVATFIMYWWGLAKFETYGRPQMLALVVVIFLGQIGLSLVWLRVFRMGPLEFVWRTLTYLRPPRMLRGAAEDPA